MNGDLFPSTEEKVFSCDGNQNLCPWLKATFMSLCLHKKETIHSSWLMYVLHTQSLQSCLTLCDPMDCSSPGSSVHGIVQATILERVAMPSSRGSFPPRSRTHISCISCTGKLFFTTATLGKPGYCTPIFYFTMVTMVWLHFCVFKKCVGF